MKSQMFLMFSFILFLKIALASPETLEVYPDQLQNKLVAPLAIGSSFVANQEQKNAFMVKPDARVVFNAGEPVGWGQPGATFEPGAPGFVSIKDRIKDHLMLGPGTGVATSFDALEMPETIFAEAVQAITESHIIEDSVWASPQDDVFSAANSAFAAGNDLFVDHLKAGPGAGVGSPVGAFSSFSDVNSAASFIWAEAGRAAAQPTESISNEEIRLDLKSGYTSDSSGFGSIGTYNDAIRAMESFDSISQYMRHMSGNAQEAAAQGFMKAAIFADEPAPGSLKVLEMTAEQILLEMWTGSDYSQFTSHPDDFSDEELEALYNSWETGSDISLDQ